VPSPGNLADNGATTMNPTLATAYIFAKAKQASTRALNKATDKVIEQAREDGTLGFRDVPAAEMSAILAGVKERHLRADVEAQGDGLWTIYIHQ
jgi:hypothetical protein